MNILGTVWTLYPRDFSGYWFAISCAFIVSCALFGHSKSNKKSPVRVFLFYQMLSNGNISLMVTVSVMMAMSMVIFWSTAGILVYLLSQILYQIHSIHILSWLRHTPVLSPKNFAEDKSKKYLELLKQFYWLTHISFPSSNLTNSLIFSCIALTISAPPSAIETKVSLSQIWYFGKSIGRNKKQKVLCL